MVQGVEFYSNGMLSNMRFSTAYSKKTTSVSNSNAATVITGESAMDSTQNLNIKSLAKSGYLTGQEVKVGDEKAGNSTTMEQLGLSSGGTLSFKIGKAPENGAEDTRETLSVDVAAGDTIESVVSKLRAATTESGVSLNVNYDEKNGRFFISSKETGADASFGVEF